MGESRYWTLGETLGSVQELQNYALNDLKSFYYDLLEQSSVESTKERLKNESIGQTEYTRAKAWLQKTDFFEAPASTRFHEAYPGGLLIHTLLVYDAAVELAQLPSFQSVSLPEAVMVALIHDWCKIGMYESYDRNVKNDTTGRWEKVAAFRRKSSPFPFGHGETSMYLGMKFFSLTEEECLALRWHMAKWYTPDVEDNELSDASHKYPLVYLLQFADQLALKEF